MLMPSALAAAAGDPASFAGLVLTGANDGRTSRERSERRFARTGSRAAGYAVSTIPARSRSRRRGSASCASSSGFACRRQIACVVGLGAVTNFPAYLWVHILGEPVGRQLVSEP